MLRRLIGIGSGELAENGNELVEQGLAFDTKKEVLKILIGQIGCPAGVLPEPHRGDMWIFFSHMVLDVERGLKKV